MGNLVFQATLGGQVNLVGPNTASTYNLNVPTVNATLATTDANTFTAAQTISSGNLIFSGTGQKVTGDYSNATLTSRAAFQTSTSNGSTGIYALPNGTSTAASWQATNAADPTNASKILIATNGSTDCQLVSGRNGSGTYLPLTFYTNGSEQMRLDTSGNLGLGVTPSAWNSVYRSMQLGTTGAISGRTDTTLLELAANAYRNSGGSFIYLTTDLAARYDIAAGVHRWYNAPSGTAGNAITFTQAMTLDASGRLGIGQTSPAYTLDVNGTMRLGSAGSIQPLLSRSSVEGGLVVNTTAGGGAAFIVQNNGTEQARIDSSGNLLVGTTSTLLSAGIGVKIQPAGYATTPTVSCVGSSSSNTADTYHVYSTGAAAFRFYVGYGGTISATSTSITGLSDVSLKENIRDLETGLSEVLNLKPRRFDWKAETEISEKNVAGFIAQEVEEVLPELVYEYKYSAEETKKSLKMGDILPTLVKAIQEMKTIIDQQAERIAALEAK